MYRFWILALLVVSAGQLRAQTTEQEVIEAARQSCAEMDSGEFSAPDDAVKRVDLDGDGTKDVLVDEGKFACSTSATLFSPSGGAQLHAIVGDDHDVWMAQAWRLVDWVKTRSCSWPSTVPSAADTDISTATRRSCGATRVR